MIDCWVYRRSAFALRSTLVLALGVALAATAHGAPPEPLPEGVTPSADAPIIGRGAVGGSRGGVTLHSSSIVFAVSRSGRRVRLQIGIYAMGPAAGSALGWAGLFAQGGVGLAQRIVGDRAIMPSGVTRMSRADGTLLEAAPAFQPFQTANRRVDSGAPATAAIAATSLHDLAGGGGQVAAVTGWAMAGNAQLLGSGTMTGALAGGATSALKASGGTIDLAGTAQLVPMGADMAVLQPGGVLHATDADRRLTFTGHVAGPGKS